MRPGACMGHGIFRFIQERWKQELEKTHPTVAFHASITNPFGKSALINLLRQFSKLHSDKKQISIGLVGYPNTGKSSIINTLKQKKVCNVAPLPGETKVWQYITLMKRIYLIDCPGVVYGSSNDTETDIVLKGVVRVENITMPEEHIKALLVRVRDEYIVNTYGIKSWTDHEHFLEQLATKGGRLLKGGEPDISTVAKMVLNDWIRGRLPFYVAPPPKSAADAEVEGAANVSDHGFIVKQNTDLIRVVTPFLPDDMKKPKRSKKVAKEGDEHNSVNEVADDEEVVEWDHVYQEPEEGSTDVPDNAKETQESSSGSDIDSEEASKPAPSKSEAQVKEKRMTTNKSKASNYYKTANVKNKNRDKKPTSANAQKESVRRLERVLKSKGSAKWIVE